MELYKLRYNLYNYLIKNTTNFEINTSNKNIWFNSLIAFYSFFIFILLINYDKINIMTIVFIIIGIIFLYYCYILDIKLNNIIEHNLLVEYTNFYKLFNSIFIDSYNQQDIKTYISDTNKNVDASLYSIINLKYDSNPNEPINITPVTAYNTIEDTETNEILSKTGIISTNLSSDSILKQVTDDSDYVYLEYKVNGTLKIENDLICDILVVGGGGSGGFDAGGGGGGGEVIYKKDYIFKKDDYIITVGLSSIVNDTIIKNDKGKNILIGKGGGDGGGKLTNGKNSNGGGGGAGHTNYGTPTINGKSLKDNGNGGLANGVCGGGGGSGYNTEKKNGTDGTIYGPAGNGGDGYITKITGENKIFGSGGGGGTYAKDVARSINNSTAGRGGNFSYSGENGLENSGGGGGGGGNSQQNKGMGGNGGSGIVIIRFKKEIIIIKNNIVRYIVVSTIKKYFLIIVNNNNEHYFIEHLIKNYNIDKYNKAKIVFKLDKTKIIISNLILNIQGDYYLIDINEISKYAHFTLYKYLIDYLKFKNNIKQLDLNNPSSSIDKYTNFSSLDTKTNYFDYFYSTLTIIRTTIKNNENIINEDMNNFINDNIINNDLLKYIDMYNTTYDNLKKYIYIKNDDTNPIFNYINTDYDTYKDNLISINTNETIDINSVIVQIKKPVATEPITPTDIIYGYIIDIYTINSYLNDSTKNNSNVSSYVSKIYNDLLMYYKTKNELIIDNFDVLYKKPKDIDIILKEQVDIFIYIFNIILALIIIILTIIMHIFYIKLYNPLKVF